MAGGMHGRGVHGRGHSWQGTYKARGHGWLGGYACVAGETATVADSTHPIGMHSCCLSQFSHYQLKYQRSVHYVVNYTVICTTGKKISRHVLKTVNSEEVNSE